MATGPTVLSRSRPYVTRGVGIVKVFGFIGTGLGRAGTLGGSFEPLVCNGSVGSVLASALIISVRLQDALFADRPEQPS